MTALRVGAVAVLCVAATGCAAGRPPGPEAPPRGARPSSPVLPPSPTVMTGKASWYGEAHHGRSTASGEVYDMTKLTAAHRTLPMGTRVRVTNVANGRAVVVRINDRGPFANARIIDVSQAAARELGVLGAGHFTVRLEVLEDAAVEMAPAGGSR